MPIQVTCPGCLSRFSVSDKYAGKKGPCPKCKKELIVPDKSQEVVIHAPEAAGPKDSKGVAVLKPIRRSDFKLTPVEIGIASSVCAVGLIGAIVGRILFAQPPSWFLALGAMAMAFPLAWLGYQFLRDDEFAAYNGKELMQRIGSCSAIFAATWGLYWFLAYYLGNKSLADVGAIEFAVFTLLMFVVGSIASLACLELETIQAVLHYAIYFGLTFLLCMVTGLELAEPLSNNKPTPFGVPSGLRNPPVVHPKPPTNPPTTDPLEASDS